MGGRLNEFPTACELCFFAFVAHVTTVFVIKSATSVENKKTNFLSFSLNACTGLFCTVQVPMYTYGNNLWEFMCIYSASRYIVVDLSPIEHESGRRIETVQRGKKRIERVRIILSTRIIAPRDVNHFKH